MPLRLAENDRQRLNNALDGKSDPEDLHELYEGDDEPIPGGRAVRAAASQDPRRCASAGHHGRGHVGGLYSPAHTVIGPTRKALKDRVIGSWARFMHIRSRGIPSAGSVALIRRILLAIACLLGVAGSASASVIYSYTGNPIDQASPNNASQLGNHMTLLLEFANALPSNASGLTICPTGCSISVLSFDAHGGGPVVASSANGGQMLSNGQVSTDASGQITEWSMTFIFLSAAIVFSSTGLSEPDLAALVFDLGEVQNTHWGASSAGLWTLIAQPVSSPGTLSLLLLGLMAAALARVRKLNR